MNKRTGKVARTAAGLTHINRLRLPSFGVNELRLKTQDGANQSASNTFKGKVAGSQTDFNFAPGVKSDNTPIDPVQIFYRLENPSGAVQRAKLELFGPYDPIPLWTLDLHPEQFRHGKHSIAWDGAVRSDVEAVQEDKAIGKYAHQLKGEPTKKMEFPDGFITAARSPYRLKITLGADRSGDPPTGWTDFYVLVHSIELELGARDTLVELDRYPEKDFEARDKSVWDSLCGPDDTPATRKAALPAEGDAEPKRISLISNLFKMHGSEMYDNTLFDQYHGQWVNGPRIPIFARVWMKNSQGAKEPAEDAAVALGNVKFLWDWKDVTEDTSPVVREPPRTYIERALDYDVDKTLPIGDNCHWDRGGKRFGRPDLKDSYQQQRFDHLFPEQDGEDPAPGHKVGQFPFKVKHCRHEDRFWASLSEAWTTGTFRGMTGVMFKPGRMAGDTYRVICYLAYDLYEDGQPLLDTELPIDAVVKASTGMLQVWRKLHISRYIRKILAIQDFFAGDAWAQVQEVYREAFIELEPVAGMAKTFLNRDTYHNAALGALKAAFNHEDPQPGDEDGSEDDASEDDGDEEESLDKVNPQLNDLFTFYVGTHHQYDGTGTAANPSGNALTFNDWDQMQKAAQNWFYARRRKKHPAESESASGTLAAVAANNWVQSTFGGDLNAYAEYLSDISQTIIEAALNKRNLLNGAPDGIAIVEFDHMNNYPSWLHEVLGIAVDMKGHTRSRCAYLGFASAAAVAAHEVGHHLMCPHAPGLSTAEGIDPTFHDQDDAHCLMSYNTPIVTFCGKCQLRLRGWDGLALDMDGTKNSR